MLIIFTNTSQCKGEDIYSFFFLMTLENRKGMKEKSNGNILKGLGISYLKGR